MFLNIFFIWNLFVLHHFHSTEKKIHPCVAKFQVYHYLEIQIKLWFFKIENRLFIADINLKD